jgi:hypothetical protein
MPIEEAGNMLWMILVSTPSVDFDLRIDDCDAGVLATESRHAVGRTVLRHSQAMDSVPR